jgi:hypothetical protein
MAKVRPQGTPPGAIVSGLMRGTPADAGHAHTPAPTARSATVIPISATGLSGVVSLAVAGFGGWVALAGSRFRADEERAKESRDRRSQIYVDYLAAARDYASEESLLARLSLWRSRLLATRRYSGPGLRCRGIRSRS